MRADHSYTLQYLSSMRLLQNIAKHFREVYFGGNWTCSNLKDQLSDVTWQQAVTEVHGLNTIATLSFHIHYFVQVVLKVLEGDPLSGNDKLSFSHPAIEGEEDWQRMRESMWPEAERFAELIATIPEERLWEAFSDEKYGIYYRNLHGIIEHSHYHLGQIAVVKKIVQQEERAGRGES